MGGGVHEHYNGDPVTCKASLCNYAFYKSLQQLTFAMETFDVQCSLLITSLAIRFYVEQQNGRETPQPVTRSLMNSVECFTPGPWLPKSDVSSCADCIIDFTRLLSETFVSVLGKAGCTND